MTDMLKCHLILSTPTEEELSQLHQDFICVKTFVDESHLFRYVLKCNICGQLYFFEFYEEIDWIEGKDPQYCTYIPVESIEAAEMLNNKSSLELLGITPRLQTDFAGDKSTIRWVK